MIISPRFQYDDKKVVENEYSHKQYQEINIVKDKLNRGVLELEDTTCPCGVEEDYGVLASVERYNIPLETVACNSCGSLRFRQYLSASSLSDFYIEHYQSMYGRLSDIPKYFIKQGSYGKRIFETYKEIFSEKDNVLEVGCGAGGALNYFKQQGLDVYGCEYSRVLVEYANSQGLGSVFQGSLFDVSGLLPSNIKFKVIYIHHVFEHVSDPIALLEKCSTLLANDGKLVIGVPDFLEIHKYKNPGCNLMTFLHIAHKYNFTSECFQALAFQAGLNFERVTLDEELHTPWSVQPELWGEFSVLKGDRKDDFGLGGSSARMGKGIYDYLVKTEEDYLNNTCSAWLPVERKRKKSLLNKLKSYFTG